MHPNLLTPEIKLHGTTPTTHPGAFMFLAAVVRPGDPVISDATISKELWDRIIDKVKVSTTYDKEGAAVYPKWHFTFVSDISLSSDFPYDKKAALPTIAERIESVLNMSDRAKEQSMDTIPVPVHLLLSVYDSLKKLQTAVPNPTVAELLKSTELCKTNPEYGQLTSEVVEPLTRIVRSMEMDVIQIRQVLEGNNRG